MIQEIIWVLSVIVIMTLIYKVLPYKQWKNKRPSFVLFPKYIAQYSSSTEDIISRIQTLDFKPIGKSNKRFIRGKAFGDFSAKWIKIEILLEREKKELRVFSRFIGIIFDNGDLWEIISNLVEDTKQNSK